MKVKLLIILAILIQCSCQNNKQSLEGSWLLVKNTSKHNGGGIPNSRGLLLHFTEDSMFSSHPIYEDIYSFPYDLIGNEIKSEGMISTETIQVTKDSLIIIGEHYDSHFRPLMEVGFSIEQKEELLDLCLGNPWEIYSESRLAKYTMHYNDEDLDDRDFGKNLKQNSWTRWMAIEVDHEESKWVTRDNWILKDFMGKIIIAQADWLDGRYFQVTKIEHELISGQFMDHSSMNWKGNSLKKVNKLTEEEIKNYKNIISGDWKMSALQNHPIDKIDSIVDKSTKGIIMDYYEVMTVTELKQNQIKIQFIKDGPCKIMAKDKILMQGKKWDILKNGRYIVFDPESSRTRYFIEIQHIEDETITIGLDSELRKEEWDEEYFAHIDLSLKLVKDN